MVNTLTVLLGSAECTLRMFADSQAKLEVRQRVDTDMQLFLGYGLHKHHQQVLLL